MRPRWKDWVVIMAIFLGAVFGAARLGGAGTRSMNVASALVIALGTAALAAYTRRFSGFPRWATATSALLLGAIAVGSAAFWPEASWHRQVHSSLWMHPWYFLTFIGLGGQPQCACLFASQKSGWLLMTGAIVVASLLPVIAALL